MGDLKCAAAAFVAYCACAIEKHHIAVGRYVIMPDHVHFFVRGNPDFVLSSWIGGLKRAMSVTVLKGPQPARLNCGGTRVACDDREIAADTAASTGKAKPLWQPGFFDHVLRNDESYGQKWEYVRDNPVRADLVKQWHEWPYQGEIVLIDRA